MQSTSRRRAALAEVPPRGRLADQLPGLRPEVLGRDRAFDWRKGEVVSVAAPAEVEELARSVGAFIRSWAPSVGEAPRHLLTRHPEGSVAPGTSAPVFL